MAFMEEFGQRIFLSNGKDAERWQWWKLEKESYSVSNAWGIIVQFVGWGLRSSEQGQKRR